MNEKKELNTKKIDKVTGGMGGGVTCPWCGEKISLLKWEQHVNNDWSSEPPCPKRPFDAPIIKYKDTLQ